MAVKLNSPYMDSICSISIKDLYDKALTANIPFHKWQSWIEKELNSKYLKMLYDTKRDGFRNLMKSSTVIR